MIGTAAELRYHTHRLGSRTRVARLYQVRETAIYAALPVVPFDHYRRGMMVSIGGIMVKKCFTCGVARELESYWASNSKSGCRESCSHCRDKK